MKNNDIEKTKKEGYDIRGNFEQNRDGLEGKFHVIPIIIIIRNCNKIINICNFIGNYRRKY